MEEERKEVIVKEIQKQVGILNQALLQASVLRLRVDLKLRESGSYPTTLVDVEIFEQLSASCFPAPHPYTWDGNILRRGREKEETS